MNGYPPSSWPRPRKPAMAWDEMMLRWRRDAWKRGILVVRMDELDNDWERQFATNIGNRLNGQK